MGYGISPDETGGLWAEFLQEPWSSRLVGILLQYFPYWGRPVLLGTGNLRKFRLLLFLDTCLTISNFIGFCDERYSELQGRNRRKPLHMRRQRAVISDVCLIILDLFSETKRI